MSKLDELNKIIEDLFVKATEPDTIKSLAKQKELVKEAMAEDQALQEKHAKLKNDYVEAVKSTVVTNVAKDNKQPAQRSMQQIVSDLKLGDVFKHVQG